MYFLFIKMVIGYLIIRFLVFDIFNILKAINGSYCANSAIANIKMNKFVCSYISGYNLFASNNQSSLDQISIAGLVLTIISIVYFVLCKRKQTRLIRWLDRNNISQQNFSVLLEDIPLFIYDDDTDRDTIEYNYEVHIHQKL